MKILGVISLVFINLFSMVGLLAVTGKLPIIFPKQMLVEANISSFQLPDGFGVETSDISDFLLERLTDRLQSDVSLRIALQDDEQEKLRGLVLPRLITTGLVRDMLRDVRKLADLLTTKDFNSFTEIRLINSSQDIIEDVAISFPGAIRSEGLDKQIIEIAISASGIEVLDVGDVEAGQTKSVVVWSKLPVDAVAQDSAALRWVGSRELKGPVYVSGGSSEPNYFESAPFSRIATVMILVLVIVLTTFGTIISIRSFIVKTSRAAVREV